VNSTVSRENPQPYYLEGVAREGDQPLVLARDSDPDLQARRDESGTNGHYSWYRPDVEQATLGF